MNIPLEWILFAVFVILMLLLTTLLLWTDSYIFRIIGVIIAFGSVGLFFFAIRNTNSKMNIKLE